MRIRNERERAFVNSLHPDNYGQGSDAKTSKGFMNGSVSDGEGENPVRERERSESATIKGFKSGGRRDEGENEKDKRKVYEDNKSERTALERELFFASPSQKKCLLHVAGIEARLNRITVPKIRFLSELSEKERKNYEFDESDCGSYYEERNDEKGTIIFNDYPGIHLNMKQALDTIIHETRHKYQYRVMEKTKRSSVRAYLTQGDVAYPTEDWINTQIGMKAYYENAFEKDSFNYAESRIAFYSPYRSSEILQMEATPGNLVHQQILMQPGDLTPDGRSSPLLAGDKYELFTVYDDYRKEGTSMGKTGIDYSLEALREAIDFYKNGIECIQNESSTLIGKLKINIEQHPYAELERSVNFIIDYYNGELKSTIKGMIEAWTSSEQCFSKMLERFHEKGESFEAAKDLEKDLENSVDEMFKRIEEVNVSKAANSDPDLVTQAASDVNACVGNLDDNAKNYKNQCEQKADTNQLYHNLRPMVEATWDYVVKAFEALKTDIGDISNEFASAIEANKRTASGTLGTGNRMDSARVKTGRIAKRNR